MTLEEAIKHCEEKACGDSECNREHKQLAEWLKELQRLKALPSTLDEAAEDTIKYKPRFDIQYELDEGNDPAEIECFAIDSAMELFKAGAEWMASQGVTSTGEVNQTSGENTLIELDEWIDLEDCDKVIVQIRKKDEPQKV